MSKSDAPKIDALTFDLPKLDAIDKNILRHLQENASISLSELSERVGLSQTPCWKRVQKLESAGVIIGRVALLDPAKLGLGLTVFALLESEDHSGAWTEAFTKFITAQPEIMGFYRMAGDVDYLLHVVVADMAAYDLFYKRLTANIALKNVTSRFVMERIKVTTAYGML